MLQNAQDYTPTDPVNRKLGEQREKGSLNSCMMSKLIQPFRNYSLD